MHTSNLNILQISQHATNACSDDRSHLRHAIASFIYRDRELKPKLVEQNKSDRGFKHEELARLLCPADSIEDYDNDTEGYILSFFLFSKIYAILYSTRQKLLRGEINCAVNGQVENWGLYLFKNYEYDAENPDTGLFRSEVLMRVRDFLFLLPVYSYSNYYSLGCESS
jgi:hypothetical protein